MTFGLSAGADTPASGTSRTRPLPDTMAAQHRLQIRKTSRWIQEDESGADLEADKIRVLTKKRRILIRELEKTVKVFKEEPKKLDLSLRLGKLYMEEYYAQMNTAFEKYEKAMEAYQKSPKGKKAPKLSRTGAMANLTSARAFYRALKAKYASSPRQDEILYYYALSSVDKGMETAAMESFLQLVDRNPRSRYTPDALAQLGDYYFRENQVEKAEGFFDKIIKRRLKPLVSYAMYKKAWCAYHLDRPEESLKLLTWVIENEKPGFADVGLRVKNEALADITLIFTELNLVDRSVSFFRGFDDAIYRRGLETMAAMYLERGKFQSAIELSENLIKSDSTHPKNPSYEIKIVEALVLKNDLEGAVNRMVRRTPLYLDDSSWNKKNSGNALTIQSGEGGLEDMVRKNALRFHDTAQKTSNAQNYGYASTLYGHYLKVFSKFPDASRMRFNLAKIYFKQNKLVDAAKEYAKVYEDESAGALRLDALVQSLASLSKELSSEKGDRIAPRGKGTEKLADDEEGTLVAYSEPETMFLDLSKIYLKAYPGQKDISEVLYERGYLMYRHRDFDRALGVFHDIVAKNAKHPTATSAAHLSLDILNRRKDYPGLVAATEKLLEIDFDNRGFRLEVEEILRRSELKLVEAMEKEEKFEKAADGYMRFCQKYGPQDEGLYERALYNAAVNFTRADRPVSALETREKFLRTFAKSRLAPQMKLDVARAHEAMGELAQAARYYGDFAQSNPKHKDAKNALQLSGWHYWGAGDMARAEKSMLAFMDLYPSDVSAEQNLLAFYEAQGFEDKVAKFHRQARSRKGIGPLEFVERTVRLAELVAKQSPREASRLLKEAQEATRGNEGALKKKGRGTELLSKLALWDLREKETRFYRIRLNKVATLEANLTKKLELLKELEKDFARVTKLGGEEMGLAAIYKAAAAHTHMAQEAAAAPVPSALAGKALEAYQREIKEVMVAPFQEKAVALVRRCLEDSHELRIFSRWTAKCFSLGSELSPEKFVAVRTFYLPPVQTALIVPDEKQSKVAIGSKDELGTTDFAASQLYGSAQEAALAWDPGSLYFGSEEPDDVASASHEPLVFDFGFLAEARGRNVERSLSSEAPGRNEVPTFAYLNLLRLRKPEQAVTAIKETLRLDPKNAALHNLLGVAYLDAGNLTAAEVTWLTMLSRGEKSGAVLNNLGILSLMRGKQSQAVQYFNDARSLEDGPEASTNLGFLALKYRNGAAAKDAFEEARRRKEETSSDVGVLVAQMQAGDLDELRGNLEDLTKRHKKDPYARLAVAYYLIDVEKDFPLASRVLSEYLEKSETKEIGAHFQRALREAAKGMNEEVASLTPVRE